MKQERAMMDLAKSLTELKKRPDFSQKVGMVLVHNGTVRGLSRDSRQVRRLEVRVNQKRLEQLLGEYKAKSGIYEILLEARTGSFLPGEDLLLLAVAGDIRENVLTVLTELLNRIKTEAIEKKEFF